MFTLISICQIGIFVEVYLHSHVFIKIWLTLADDLSTYSSIPSAIYLRSNIGIYEILEQPVSGSIIIASQASIIVNECDAWPMLSY